jgi:hypothetical protein
VPLPRTASHGSHSLNRSRHFSPRRGQHDGVVCRDDCSAQLNATTTSEALPYAKLRMFWGASKFPRGSSKRPDSRKRRRVQRCNKPMKENSSSGRTRISARGVQSRCETSDPGFLPVKTQPSLPDKRYLSMAAPASGHSSGWSCAAEPVVYAPRFPPLVSSRICTRMTAKGCSLRQLCLMMMSCGIDQEAA